jgi:hypothetical protein
MELPSKFADAKHAAMKAFWRLGEAKAKANDEWFKGLAEWNKACQLAERLA